MVQIALQLIAPERTRVQDPYTIVSLQDLVDSSRDAINTITSVLQLSEEEATRALHRYNWCVP